MRHRWLALSALAALLVSASALARWNAPVTAGLLVLGLLVLARVLGLTRAELGLSPGWVTRGARWGAGTVLLMAAVLGAVLATPVLRERLAPGEASVAGLVLKLAVVIPFQTVLPEELAFRGVTLGVLTRGWGGRTAWSGSALLFGLWHIAPGLAATPANATAAGVLGSGSLAVVLRVLATVLVTALAGVVFAVMRTRSGSLLASITAHYLLNAAGTLLLFLA